MKIKKSYVALIAIIGAAIGVILFGGTAAMLHYTSSTQFCVSCHTMELPYEEYQGSIHYTNSKGIRAECSDCHIPQEPIDYLITKIKASKDIYHQFITGKIDTEEKYESHRLAMAQTVWDQLKATDSATCRSCHTFDAMDLFEQSEDAAKMHQYAIDNNQTCIDCHKGVAHFAPTPELNNEEFELLLQKAQDTKPDAKVVYPLEPIAFDKFGTINPTVSLDVIEYKDNQRKVRLNAYQLKGADTVLYMAAGKRAIVASINADALAAAQYGEFVADEYGNEWRTVVLEGMVDNALLVDSQEPIWDYATKLDDVYCATCHAKIPAGHFTVNSWGPVAKGMGARTDISDLNLEILTKFFQYHAKDVVGH